MRMLRLTVTVADEDGTVLDSGDVRIEDSGSAVRNAKRAISEAAWYFSAGMGWPDLSDNE